MKKTQTHKPKKWAKKTLQNKREVYRLNELLQYLRPEEQKELLKLITEAVRIYINVYAARPQAGK